MTLYRRGNSGNVILFVTTLMLIGYGYIKLSASNETLHKREQDLVRTERHGKILKEQLKVVYHHTTKLEEALKKERERHKNSKHELLTKVKEFEVNLTKAKHEAQNRFNALDTEYKMLKASNEEVQQNHLVLQQQYVRLSEDHKRMGQEYKQDYQKLKSSKESESIALQDRVQELYNLKVHYQEMAKQYEEYYKKTLEHIKTATELARQYQDRIKVYEKQAHHARSLLKNCHTALRSGNVADELTRLRNASYVRFVPDKNKSKTTLGHSKDVVQITGFASTINPQGAIKGAFNDVHDISRQLPTADRAGLHTSYRQGMITLNTLDIKNRDKDVKDRYHLVKENVEPEEDIKNSTEDPLSKLEDITKDLEKGIKLTNTEKELPSKKVATLNVVTESAQESEKENENVRGVFEGNSETESNTNATLQLVGETEKTLGDNEDSDRGKFNESGKKFLRKQKQLLMDRRKGETGGLGDANSNTGFKRNKKRIKRRPVQRPNIEEHDFMQISKKSKGENVFGERDKKDAKQSDDFGTVKQDLLGKEMKDRIKPLQKVVNREHVGNTDGGDGKHQVGLLKAADNLQNNIRNGGNQLNPLEHAEQQKIIKGHPHQIQPPKAAKLADSEAKPALGNLNQLKPPGKLVAAGPDKEIDVIPRNQMPIPKSSNEQESVKPAVDVLETRMQNEEEEEEHGHHPEDTLHPPALDENNVENINGEVDTNHEQGGETDEIFNDVKKPKHSDKIVGNGIDGGAGKKERMDVKGVTLEDDENGDQNLDQNANPPPQGFNNVDEDHENNGIDETDVIENNE